MGINRCFVFQTSFLLAILERYQWNLPLWCFSYFNRLVLTLLVRCYPLGSGLRDMNLHWNFILRAIWIESQSPSHLYRLALWVSTGVSYSKLRSFWQFWNVTNGIFRFWCFSYFNRFGPYLLVRCYPLGSESS